MRPGPRAAVGLLPTVLSIDSPPRYARQLLVDIAVDQAWAASGEHAAELAERWEDNFLASARSLMTELHNEGRPCQFAFNSSSEQMLQGAAFIEPGVDSEQTRHAKLNRARLGDYTSCLKGISPEEFELLCRGMLGLTGVEDAVLTPRTADEGLDFYGTLRLSAITKAEAFPGFYSRLNVWMVGQAKHYQAGQAATPDIRDLVGAVVLAKGSAYGRVAAPYPDLVLRACDPVFYLFFTTGAISAPGWRLLKRSGVVGMDGEMVCAFLADRGIGVVDNVFDPAAFHSWMYQTAT